MSLIDLISPVGRLLRAGLASALPVGFAAPESSDTSGEWTHDAVRDLDEDVAEGRAASTAETKESRALVLSIVSIVLITVGVLAHAG